ncbi:hypothetical protein HYS00_05470 [Candidatus Microgenomates bacterium]|nr:hypothetical protein [Candidatus Microgenomates bacterium]
MIDFTRIFGSNHVVFGLFFKSFAVIGSAMYFIYALVLIRQTSVMIRSLEEAHTGVIKIISYVQLFVALLLIILALTIL